MNGEMIIVIVLIVAIAGVLKARYGAVRTERGNADVFVGNQRNTADAERLHGEIRQLKDRIAVLERIVTDGDRNRGIALEREIEALRTDKEFRP